MGPKMDRAERPSCRRALSFGLCAGLALAACGDDDGGGGSFGLTGCPPFEACGGDVVGTWALTGLCVDELEDNLASGDARIGARHAPGR